MRKRHKFYVELPGDDAWWSYVWVESDEAEVTALKAGNYVGHISTVGGISNDVSLLTPLYCRLFRTIAAQRRLFRSFNRKVRSPRK